MPERPPVNSLSTAHLLAAEQAEQSRWSTFIPGWHPRNEDEPPKDPPKDEAKGEQKKDEPLGPNGERALAAERDARRAAETRAKEAERERDALKASQLSDQEKLEKRAEDGDRKLAEATSKLQRANLQVALAGHGLVGGKGKAAARLLDVEFDADDEPKDLVAAIEKAKAEYDPAMFTAANGKPSDNGKAPEDKKDEKQDEGDPDLKQGARGKGGDPDEDALLGQYIKSNFPVFEPEGAK